MIENPRHLHPLAELLPSSLGVSERKVAEMMVGKKNGNHNASFLLFYAGGCAPTSH
jgi:hypothetical protein